MSTNLKPERPLRSFALLAAVALLALGPPASHAAKIKCWTNNEGIKECGNKVPPEYAQQGHEERSESGIKTGEQERALNAEEVAELKRQEEERKREERIAAEQAERDRVLLATFTSEGDLELAKQDRLQVIEARINHREELVTKLEETLKQMQAEAAAAERSGQPIPKKLQEDLAEIQRQMAESEEFIGLRHMERDEVRAQFDRDLERFRQLKGKQAKSE